MLFVHIYKYHLDIFRFSHYHTCMVAIGNTLLHSELIKNQQFFAAENVFLNESCTKETVFVTYTNPRMKTGEPMKLLDRTSEENARSYAIRVLLFNIVSLELPPGSAVSENELSSVMNLSRTPVREALIELSRMNLVEIRPQRGSYIARIDYDLIEESRFMRLVLESAVLKLACEQGMSEAHMTHLKRILKLQREFQDSEDVTQQLDLDNLFHRTIFESVNKLRTYNVLRSQMVHFDRIRTLSLKSVKNSRTIDDHENIIYALERRDAELAEMLIARHLSRYQIEKDELLSRHPEYFA